jgi:hypothetical protein
VPPPMLMPSGDITSITRSDPGTAHRLDEQKAGTQPPRKTRCLLSGPKTPRTAATLDRCASPLKCGSATQRSLPRDPWLVPSGERRRSTRAREASRRALLRREPHGGSGLPHDRDMVPLQSA